MIRSLQQKKLFSVLTKHAKATLGKYPKIIQFPLAKDIVFRKGFVIMQNAASLKIKYNYFFSNHYSINFLESFFIRENTLQNKNVK